MKAEIKNSSNIQDIFFPVRLEATKDITGMDANPECVNSVVATIDGNDRVLATCGERYNLISNEEIFTPIMEQLKDYSYEVQISMRNLSGFEVKFNITDDRLATDVGNGDLIYPQVSLNRSYNSSSKYNGHVGYFRLICSNGLEIPVEGKANLAVKGKHTEKLSRTLEKISGMIDTFIEDAKVLTKKYEVLTDRQIINYGERVEAVMEAAEIKKGKDDIMATIRTEMALLGVDVANDWLVYNGINRYIYNENVKTDEVRRELDMKVMNVMIEA